MTQVYNISDKATAFLRCVQHGLHLHSEQTTAIFLGDRSQYIGISDIGRALECPRAALYNKVYTRPQANLQQLLTLQRGHWLEHGIEQAFKAQDIHILPQLELSFTHNNTPIKAHFDLVLAWEQPHPAIRIVELKSTQNLPDTLYTAYEMQLYGQVSFMERLWNKAVFTLRGEDGTLLYANRTMPQLMKEHFCLTLPNDINRVDVEAWVLCVSMDNAKAFGAYKAHTDMCTLCLNTAEKLWEQKIHIEQGNDIQDVEYASGFHALCAYCHWNADCPKFHKGSEQSEWQSHVENLCTLKEERTALDAKISTLEQGLKDAYTLSALQGDWINTGSYRFKVNTQKGRRTLNKDALRQHLYDICGDTAEHILSACEQEGKPFQRLSIYKINK